MRPTRCSCRRNTPERSSGKLATGTHCGVPHRGPPPSLTSVDKICYLRSSARWGTRRAPRNRREPEERCRAKRSSSRVLPRNEPLSSLLSSQATSRLSSSERSSASTAPSPRCSRPGSSARRGGLSVTRRTDDCQTPSWRVGVEDPETLPSWTRKAVDRSASDL